jgi:hypothetical protein
MTSKKPFQMVLFNRERGYYATEGGERLPSVTGAIRAAGLSPDYSMIDPYYSKRGQDVHLGTDRMDFGTSIDDLVREAPEYENYFLAWQTFRSDVPFRVVESERLAYHPILLYCGKPDRHVLFTGPGGEVPGIVDIKTGSGPNPGLFPQVCAYGDLVRSISYPKRKLTELRLMAVRLRADGKYQIVDIPPLESTVHFSVFLSCLAIFHWRRRYSNVDFSEEEERT